MVEIGAADPVVGPGQYLYLKTHAWWGSTTHCIDRGGRLTQLPLSRLVEHVHETWVPDDRDVEWLHRRTTTGNYQWIVGSDAEAEERSLEPVGAHTEEYRAVRGEFFGPPHPAAGRPRTRSSSQVCRPTPRRCSRSCARTRQGRGKDPDLEMLIYVADVLRPGLVPAHVRANLYRTLEMVPGMDVTTETRVLFGITRKGWRGELAVDRETGQVVGERTTHGDAVWSTSTVSTSVVDHY